MTSITRTEAAPSTLRILAVAGSVRPGSYNRRLVRAAAAHAPAGMLVDVYDDLASIPIFNEDLEQPKGGPEPVRALRAWVAAADGVLISTPEYNQSLPGVLKNAVDWLSRPDPELGEVLSGKPVAVMGATAGRWGTRLAQSALRHTLYATESLVMPAPSLFVRDAPTLFDDSGALVDKATRRQLVAMLTSFGRWVAR